MARGKDGLDIGTAALAGLKSTLSWVGVVAGILSAASAITHIFSLGLRGVFERIVDFYRGLLSPVYELVRLLGLSFEVSQFQIDLAALYLVLFGMSLRARPKGVKLRITTLYVVSLLTLYPALTLQPLRLLLMSYLRRHVTQWPAPTAASKKQAAKWVDALVSFSVIKEIGAADERKRADQLLRDYTSVAIQFVCIPLALVLFLVLNALA